MKKRLLAFVLTVCVVFSFAVSLHAVSGLFEYTLHDGYATVTKYVGSVKHVVVPDTLGGLPVKEIGLYAFDASSATQITLPATVETIAGGAFNRCTSLTAIYVDEGNTAFYDIDGVLFTSDDILLRYPQARAGAYTAPDGTKEIASYAFDDSVKLTSVVLPEGVTVVGNYAFGGCTALTDVTLPDSLQILQNGAFYCDSALREMLLPQNVSYIGDYVFYRCSSLAYLTVVGSNTTYATENNVLYNKDFTTLLCCPGGVSGTVTVPDTVKEIAPSAFLYNSRVTSVTVPNGVEKIGAGAFSFCTALESIVLPDSVTEMEEFAFDGCTSLKSIKLSYRLTEISFAAFMDCVSLEKVVIPDSVTKLCNYAFYNCKSLTNATVTSGTHLTVIGRFAFQNCASLKKFDIPEGVTEIGQYAFYGCTSMTGACTPTTCTVIGSNAFTKCTSLVYLAVMKQTTGFGYPIISSNTTVYCGSSSSPVYAEAVSRGYKVVCKGSLSDYKPSLPSPLPDPDPLPEPVNSDAAESDGAETSSDATSSSGAETSSDAKETQSSGAEISSDATETQSSGAEISSDTTETQSSGAETSSGATETQSSGAETSVGVLGAQSLYGLSTAEVIFGYISGSIKVLSAEVFKQADTDRDGRITLQDVIMLAQQE